jgi:hypothetical protein
MGRSLVSLGQGALLGIGLAGCTHLATPPAPPPGQVTIAPGIVLSLPSPAALQREVEAQQLVTAHYGDSTFVFEARISVTPSRMLVVATDTLGRRAMTMTWTGAVLRSELAPWVPAELRPQNVLADIVLQHWPIGAVRAALGPPAMLQTPHRSERLVTLDGRAMIRLRRLTGAPDSWSGHWTYHHLAWGYSLDIRSVEDSP